MLSALDCQRRRLKYMISARISEDVDELIPGNVNRIRREEEDEGVDIEWKYGRVFAQVYRMMVDVYRVIDASCDPYEDPVVLDTLAKYEYYISPSGRHIYGAGPKFK